jgi:2-polyprenyl-3-methyl-5-hydroxy-6-metoxy-1,4-benzoquinol methylase
MNKEILQQLLEHAPQIDHHLNRLGDFSELLEKVKVELEREKTSDIREFLHEMRELKLEVATLRRQLEAHGLPPLDLYEQRFDFLRRHIETTEWPAAVEDVMMPKTEEDWKRRGELIMDLVVLEFIAGLRFLDFGCGGGDVVAAAERNGAAVAVGYDVSQTWGMGDTQRRIFTTDLETVRKMGPFDVILLYDVLDHLREDPVQVLSKVASLLSPQGRVYVRCHPWCGKTRRSPFQSNQQSIRSRRFR